jgi:hypothetical protein
VNQSNSKVVLCALVRCHKRDKTLKIVLSELRRYGQVWPGVEVRIVVMADRPSAEVRSLLDASAGPDLLVVKAPRPLVGPSGENFLHPLNVHLDAAERFVKKIDWCYLADDDRWLDPACADEEIQDLLHDRELGLLFARSIFFWDNPNTFNAERHHVSPIMWRHSKGERWSGQRMIQAPDSLHDSHIISGAIHHLKSPLLDYGSYTLFDRQDLYKVFTEAGKNDPYIDSLLSRPLIEFYPADAAIRGWRQLDLPFDDLWSKCLTAPTP